MCDWIVCVHVVFSVLRAQWYVRQVQIFNNILMCYPSPNGLKFGLWNISPSFFTPFQHMCIVYTRLRFDTIYIVSPCKHSARFDFWFHLFVFFAELLKELLFFFWQRFHWRHFSLSRSNFVELFIMIWRHVTNMFIICS